MFENLVNQDAGTSLKSDIKNHTLPGALLFSGENASGKLTAALETARILSCHANPAGAWTCECQSCLRHKSLLNSNLMVLGPRDCFLEIKAAYDTFIRAAKENASYIVAARYLFLRSIRKLTLRFNSILLQGDSNLNKIGAAIDDINTDLEEIDFPRQLPPLVSLEPFCLKLVEKALKLETEFLYNSIPINQIRNMEEWAHKKSEEGKKTVIIENADKMLPGVRNALLKILEEPPADCLFILLTSKRNAIMETILSRVRTYNFKSRDINQQKSVISRVFHNDKDCSINDYLLTFLPVDPEIITSQADYFYTSVANRQIPDIDGIVKKCGKFVPRVQLKLFLNQMVQNQRPLHFSPEGSEFCSRAVRIYQQCWENITMYNQSPVSALEVLLRDLSALNNQSNFVMRS